MNEIELVQTCGACPEQYDAFCDGEQVAYLRLRHGYFRVEYPDVGGETIYEADTIGDGIFDFNEREFHLSKAKRAIEHKLKIANDGDGAVGDELERIGRAADQAVWRLPRREKGYYSRDYYRYDDADKWEREEAIELGRQIMAIVNNQENP